MVPSDLSLSLLPDVLTTNGNTGVTLAEYAFPFVAWLALAGWNAWHHAPHNSLTRHMQTRRAQITGLGLLSVAVMGPSAAIMTMGNADSPIKMPAWARLAQPGQMRSLLHSVPKPGPEIFSVPKPGPETMTGICIGFGLGVAAAYAASRCGCSYFGAEKKPQAELKEVESLTESELKLQVAKLQAEIDRRDRLQAEAGVRSRASSQVGSRCPSRCTSPSRDRLSQGCGGTPTMTPCQSPRKSYGSPRKSCDRFSLDSTTCGCTPGRFSLDSTTAGSLKTDTEDGDLWASPLPHGVSLEDSELKPGQMTPPTGWHSDHFEMNRDDEIEEHPKKPRYSIEESTYGDDVSWVM